MACHIHSNTLTRVVNESTFSLGSHMLTKYHFSILHENVLIVILTQIWLHIFKYQIILFLLLLLYKINLIIYYLMFHYY